MYYFHQLLCDETQEKKGKPPIGAYTPRKKERKKHTRFETQEKKGAYTPRKKERKKEREKEAHKMRTKKPKNLWAIF